MPETFDLIIKNGEIATADSRQIADIGVKDGKIAVIGHLAAAAADEVFDATGLTVLPGVIDTQVHLREPGNEHKEDLATGTAAAALGGVTAVCEMPNTRPATTTAEALADKLRRALGRAWVDHAFFVGAAAENVDELARLESLPGCAGVKVFMGSSTGSLLVEDDILLARVLTNGKRRVAVHAEDETRLRERKALIESGASAAAHPLWRDAKTALLATTRLLSLARAIGRPVHVLHVTTAEEMELLGRNKDIATVEVTPQHLTLAAPDCYERLGTLAQMNPPIRDEAHRQALWRAVADGVVDVIGSDHAPHTLAEKAQPYPQSPSGMPGVQTLVPVMLDHVAAGRLSLARFVALTSTGPADIYGMDGKGHIAQGYDADFTVVDLSSVRRITNQWIASRCGWTPFDGMTVTGWPIATIIRGSVVMRDGALLGDAAGRPLTYRQPAGAR
jgi:dihydroorotase